jgi:hypothetical protein
METAPFVEKAAQKISALGLTAPAILLLEAHKPLAFISSQALLVAQPMLDIFLPHHLVRHTAELLADSHQLEQLIASLEIKAASPTDSTLLSEQ